MLRRFAFSFLFALGLGLLTAPATAAVQVLNGDFSGARNSASGQIEPTPIFFGSHTYLTDFAWTNTGSGALSYILDNAAQANLFAPANPAGYSGNIYAADASTVYDQGTYLLQTLSGLTVGQSYVVSFLQASGSLYSGAGDTAQWAVGFGGSILTDSTGLASLSSDAAVKSSTLMLNDTANGSAGWQRQSLSFTATDASQLLSFFATGSGAPPFALLADVSITAVPETTTWLMMVFGLGLVGVALRRATATRRAALEVACGSV